jgi:hypothetical protein
MPIHYVRKMSNQKKNSDDLKLKGKQIRGIMKILDMDDMEGQFGLMLRDKVNHDNYVLIKLSDLDRIFNYYSQFKSQIKSYDKKSGKNELY